MINKFKYLILILILLGILLPEPVSAVIGTGLFDLFDHMLHGIAEKTGMKIALMILVAVFYLLGLVLLHGSISILQAFIVQQPLWLESLRPMTMAGWDFVAGLANMLLIIVFIIIAFAFIFKIESFQAKKALPKLIAVAFLINFSLLFVNMAIDVTQILFNTILGAVGADFWDIVIDAIIGPLTLSIVGLIVLLVSLTLVLSIPIASAFGQIIFSALFYTVILPFMLLLLVQMFLFYPLALIFTAFAFLFAARVFVLQILAILAPLALVSLILPQTKSFWNFWFKTLVEWLLLGVVFLFLLVLGFSVLGLLTPPAPSAPTPVNLPGPLAVIGTVLSPIFSFISYYFAVFIYMAVILYIGKKFLPAGAQGVIGAIQGMGNMAMSRGIPKVTNRMAGRAAKMKAEGEEKREAERGQYAARMAKRLEEGGSRRLKPWEMPRAKVWSFKEQTPDSMRTVQTEAALQEKGIHQREVRRRMAEMKDFSPEEHAAAMSAEMRKRKPDRYKVEAHSKSANIREINPELAGKAQKFIDPNKYQVDLAKEISPTLFNEHKADATDPSKGGDPKISEAAADLKAAARVIKDTTPDRLVMAQGELDNKRIREEISNIGTRRFGDIATPKMFNNIQVLFGMNSKQLDSLEERGKHSARQSLHNLVENNKNDILAEVRRLNREGKKDRAKELSEMVADIKNNSNFQ